MDEQLVFFVDILGFRNAKKSSAIVDLLSELALLRGDFEIDPQPTDNGTAFKLRPAITTFSDNIVISYRTKDVLAHTNDLGLAFVSAEKLVSVFAAAAIRLGLMIRGGATIGLLHHKHGVVVGDAMVEAYELESTVAVYPRIACSQSLYSSLNGGFRTLLLETDYDGIRHFNYFRTMIARSATPAEGVGSWLENTRATVAQNIETFEGSDWNKMAKWVWFSKHLEEAYSTYPPKFFVEALEDEGTK